MAAPFIIWIPATFSPFVLKSEDYGNDQPNNNYPNEKVEDIYNNSNDSYIIKHKIMKILPPQINTILVEAWGVINKPSEKSPGKDL